MSIARKVMEQPGRYSIQQLRQAMERGILPAYIAVPLIQEKTQMQKQFQQQQMMRQPPVKQMPPIAQQVMQEARGMGSSMGAEIGAGVDGLPSNLPQEYAAGGIVAFDEGGEVERYDRGGATSVPWNRIVPAILGIQPTEEELEEERIKEEQKRIKEALRIEALREEQKPKAGIAGLAASANDPTTNTSAAEIAVPGMGGYEAPVAATRRTFSDAETQQIVEQMRAKGMRVGLDTYKDIQAGRLPPELSAPPATPAAPAAAPAAKPPGAPPAAGPGAGSPAGIAGLGSAFAPSAPPKSPSMVDVTQRALYGTETEPGLLARSAARQRENEARVAAEEGKITGKAYEGLEASLRKEAEQMGADKEQAKHMAIFKAGLAMMAGTSRHALQNIGAGAMVGAEDYQKAAADIKKAQKENQRMMAQIEQARRAEDMGNRDRAIARLDKAEQFAQRMDEYGVNAIISATGMDRENATKIWSTQFGGAKTIEAEKIRAGSREDVAMLRGMLSGEKGGMTAKQRGDTLLALENSPNVVAYKKKLTEQLGSKAQDTPQFKDAVAKKVQQEYQRLYGDRGVPSGTPSSGLTPQQIEFLKQQGLAQYFSGLQ